MKGYLIIIFSPIIIAILNGYVATYHTFRWGYDNKNEISTTLFVLSFLGCALVIYLNSVSKKKWLWYGLPLLIGLIDVFVAYTIHSLSSFGF